MSTERKDEVRIVQVRLKDAGFDPGTVDGISGPDTRAAVARFRSGCGALKAMAPAVLETAGSGEQSDMSGPSAAKSGRNASKKAHAALLRRDANGANRSSPAARSSSAATPAFQY